MLSLHARISLWLLASILVLVGISWAVTSVAPLRFTETFVISRLEHDAESLLVGLQFNADGKPVLAPNYVSSIYDRPYSGHYYVIQAGTYRLRSRSLWDADLPPAANSDGQASVSRIRGPDKKPLLVWSKTYHKAGRVISFQLAEDLGPLQEMLVTFRLRFALAMALLLVVLVVASRWIVRWGLKPLYKSAKECQQLQSGEISFLDERAPREIRPLVGEVNRLLALMRRRLERSRNATGNLAHTLKNPLALLSQLSERTQDPVRSGMQDAINKMNQSIDHELKRARLSGDTGAERLFEVLDELRALIQVMEKVHQDRNVVYQLEALKNVRYPGDRQDLLELFGNLLDNAGKWARHTIRITVEDMPGLSVSIEDDGEGVDPAMLASLSQRGLRVDENVPGHGIGLSIVQEIVTEYGGDIEYSRSPLGGLCVKVSLPERGIAL